MRRVRKLLELSPRDLRLLLRAGLVVAAVQLALRVLTVRSVQTLFARASTAPLTPRTAGSSIPRLAWAVAIVGPPLGAACLARALALQYLLARRGVIVRLWLGVRRPDDAARPERALQAHAWLEHEGAVLGAPALLHYTPLASWHGGDVDRVQ